MTEREKVNLAMILVNNEIKKDIAYGRNLAQAEKTKGKAVFIGKMISDKKGVCRHKALITALVLREFGIKDISVLRGRVYRERPKKDVKIHGNDAEDKIAHLWLSGKIDGVECYIDPMWDSIRLLGEEDRARENNGKYRVPHVTGKPSFPEGFKIVPLSVGFAIKMLALEACASPLLNGFATTVFIIGALVTAYLVYSKAQKVNAKRAKPVSAEKTQLELKEEKPAKALTIEEATDMANKGILRDGQTVTVAFGDKEYIIKGEDERLLIDALRKEGLTDEEEKALSAAISELHGLPYEVKYVELSNGEVRFSEEAEIAFDSEGNIRYMSSTIAYSKEDIQGFANGDIHIVASGHTHPHVAESKEEFLADASLVAALAQIGAYGDGEATETIHERYVNADGSIGVMDTVLKYADGKVTLARADGTGYAFDEHIGLITGHAADIARNIIAFVGVPERSETAIMGMVPATGELYGAVTVTGTEAGIEVRRIRGVIEEEPARKIIPPTEGIAEMVGEMHRVEPVAPSVAGAPILTGAVKPQLRTDELDREETPSFNDLYQLARELREAGYYEDKLGIVFDSRSEIFSADKMREVMPAFGEDSPVIAFFIVAGETDKARLPRGAIPIAVGEGESVITAVERALAANGIKEEDHHKVSIALTENDMNAIEAHYSALDQDKAMTAEAKEEARFNFLVAKDVKAVRDSQKNLPALNLANLMVKMTLQDKTTVMALGFEEGELDKFSGIKNILGNLLKLIPIGPLEIARYIHEFIISTRETARSL